MITTIPLILLTEFWDSPSFTLILQTKQLMKPSESQREKTNWYSNELEDKPNVYKYEMYFLLCCCLFLFKTIQPLKRLLPRTVLDSK